MSKVVCPHCGGNGIEPGSGITFTRDDVDEAFGDDWAAREEGVKAWTTYGELCSRCRGRNVVDRDTLDEDEQEEVRAQFLDV